MVRDNRVSALAASRLALLLPFRPRGWLADPISTYRGGAPRPTPR
jgi:hypothetical protein